MAPHSFARPHRVGALAVVAFALGTLAGFARCTLAFDPTSLPAAPDGGTLPGGCTTSSDCTLNNATAVCSAGVCAVSVCSTGFGDCNGIVADGCETDLTSDPGNCGGCAAQGAQHACVAGMNSRAVCRNMACTIECVNNQFRNCDGDTANGCETDALNPATCGACSSQMSCVAPRANCSVVADGGIGCVAGCGTETACPSSTGGTTTCANLETSPTNCGMCGHVCAPNSVCMASMCVACALGQAVCGASCVDVQNDLNHCGSCAHACPAGTTRCVAGRCL